MSERELDGRVALVTGASRGIGRAIALKLAGMGARVAVNYCHSRDKADEVVADIERAGGCAAALQADVRDGAAVKAMIKSIVKEWGGVDILVNNAGVVRNVLLMGMDDDAWDEVVDTSLKGAYLCSKYALRSMFDRGWGRIINISSVSAIRGNYGQANYAAAKGGLISFTRSLAREAGGHGITVNVITPGLIKTDMMDTVPLDQQRNIISSLAIQRPGLPEEVAELVAFLATDRAAYITAQMIGIDGGRV